MKIIEYPHPSTHRKKQMEIKKFIRNFLEKMKECYLYNLAGIFNQQQQLKRKSKLAFFNNFETPISYLLIINNKIE